MSSPQATVADVIGETLADLGVDTVFGVIGSGNFVATEALRRRGARFVAARHESGATMMADGWARVTGRVGVCSVHQGPGLTNATTALAEAAKSRSPLLVLSGDTPAAALTSNFRIDQDALPASVGALSERISGAGSAAADTARALRRAERERRPVVLNMPIDIQAQPAPGSIPPFAPSHPVSGSPAPHADDIAAAVALLEHAERPLLIAGRGAVLSGAGRAIAALAEHTGALLANSAVAHGIFDGNEWALGISGGFATPLAAELLPQADVIVAFGAALNHWTTQHGRLIGAEARLVQVDVEERAIGLHRPAALGIVGDARATAEALTDAAPQRAGWHTPELRGRIAASSWSMQERAPSPNLHPGDLSVALADLLPHDKTVVIDSGHFTGWPAMYLDVADPRCWLFVNGFQCVGLGLGAAIGAAVAHPDPTHITVAAVGDGGLFLSLQELDTAARVNARLLIVVYDDEAYGAEVHHFGPKGYPTDIVTFPPVDLGAIAAAAGVPAITVRSADALAAPLTDWMSAGSGPLLVDAKVDPSICADWLADAFRGG